MARYVCPNPTCRKLGCYDHCNHCGKPVRWRPSKLDREIAYAGPKPLNMDDSVHRCMLSGTKDGQYYKTEPYATLKQKLDYLNVPGWTPQQIEAMKDPKIKAEWEKQRKEWLDKWEQNKR